MIKVIIRNVINYCDLIISWNVNINSFEDYIATDDGLKDLAATCMLLEAIGESVKKIDSIKPNFLSEKIPEIPWKSIKGLRDHIAHEYFNIDAEIIFDIMKKDIPVLRQSLEKILTDQE